MSRAILLDLPISLPFGRPIFHGGFRSQSVTDNSLPVDRPPSPCLPCHLACQGSRTTSPLSPSLDLRHGIVNATGHKPLLPSHESNGEAFLLQQERGQVSPVVETPNSSPSLTRRKLAAVCQEEPPVRVDTPPSDRLPSNANWISSRLVSLAIWQTTTRSTRPRPALALALTLLLVRRRRSCRIPPCRRIHAA